MFTRPPCSSESSFKRVSIFDDQMINASTLHKNTKKVKRLITQTYPTLIIAIILSEILLSRLRLKHTGLANRIIDHWIIDQTSSYHSRRVAYHDDGRPRMNADCHWATIILWIGLSGGR